MNNPFAVVLVYRPIFCVRCFHMSHCCGTVSCNQHTGLYNACKLKKENKSGVVNGLSYLIRALHHQSPHNQLHSSQKIRRAAPAPGWLQVFQNLRHRFSRPYTLLQDDQGKLLKHIYFMILFLGKGVKSGEQETSFIYKMSHLRLSSQVLNPVEDHGFGLKQVLLFKHLGTFALIKLRPSICLHRPLLHTQTNITD